MTSWGEEEQWNERVFPLCGETSDMELATTRWRGFGSAALRHIEVTV